MATAPAGTGPTSNQAPLPLLLVDDDQAFRQRLAVTLERRGFSVLSAGGVAEARRMASQARPGYAVVDMRLEDGHGLHLVADLRSLRPDGRLVLLDRKSTRPNSSHAHFS